MTSSGQPTTRFNGSRLGLSSNTFKHDNYIQVSRCPFKGPILDSSTDTFRTDVQVVDDAMVRQQ